MFISLQSGRGRGAGKAGVKINKSAGQAAALSLLLHHYYTAILSNIMKFGATSRHMSHCSTLQSVVMFDKNADAWKTVYVKLNLLPHFLLKWPISASMLVISVR